MLIPLLAGAMRALYGRLYYVEHLLFLILTHASTFVLYSLMLIALTLAYAALFATIAGFTALYSMVTL